MATIRRKILIDAPASLVYSLWSDPGTYPSFIDGLGQVLPAEGDGFIWRPTDSSVPYYLARLVETAPDTRILWISADAPWSRLDITLASLPGPSTWVVCEADVVVDPSLDVVLELERTSRNIGAWLRKVRDLAEASVTGASEPTTWVTPRRPTN